MNKSKTIEKNTFTEEKKKQMLDSFKINCIGINCIDCPFHNKISPCELEKIRIKLIKAKTKKTCPTCGHEVEE